MKHTDAEFRARARGDSRVNKQLEVEFDDDAKVSRVGPRLARHLDREEGAYVQAWVWVEFPDDIGPYTVGLVDGTGEPRQFATEVEAAMYISTLPNHNDGRYYLDGPTGEVD